MKLIIKLPKPRNLFAAEFFRSGANKPRVERSKKPTPGKQSTKPNLFNRLGAGAPRRLNA